MTKQERNVCARINCSYICHRKNNSKSFFISKKVIDFFKKNGEVAQVVRASDS